MGRQTIKKREINECTMINSYKFSKGSEHDAGVENTRGESEKDSLRK